MANYTTSEIQSMITSAALSAGVDPALALAVAQQESSFNPNAVSPTNKNGTTDYGLFQLNSANLSAWGVTNPLDPTQNINAGIAYLAQLQQQYGGDVQTMLWAYNAGPGDVSNGILPASTSEYISQVTAAIPGFSSALPADLSTDSGTTDTSVYSSDSDSTYVYVAGGIVLVGLLAFVLSD